MGALFLIVGVGCIALAAMGIVGDWIDGDHADAWQRHHGGRQ